jgi:hypothetical protein
VAIVVRRIECKNVVKISRIRRVVHGAAAGGEAAFGCDALRVNRLMCRRSTLHFLRGNVSFVDLEERYAECQYQVNEAFPA